MDNNELLGYELLRRFSSSYEKIGGTHKDFFRNLFKNAIENARNVGKSDLLERMLGLFSKGELKSMTDKNELALLLLELGLMDSKGLLNEDEKTFLSKALEAARLQQEELKKSE